jgi:ABC-type uncharacterized transport system substrate-binding protein
MPSRMLQRPLIDLIAALRRHVELLRIYAHHAFQERNELFLVRCRLYRPRAWDYYQSGPPRWQHYRLCGYRALSRCQMAWLLKDTAPNVSRVVVIFDPQNLAMTAYLEAIKAAAPSFGISLTLADVRDAADIERAITPFAQHPNGGMIVVPNAVTMLHRDRIIGLAAQYKLPAIYSYRLFTKSGGFISYGVDLADQYRQAASYVDLVLKGAKPGDLPVQLPTKYELIVNLKTAKALGLTIPEAFLQTADEVIE